jgi:Na+/alanine symporter
VCAEYLLAILLSAFYLKQRATEHTLHFIQSAFEYIQKLALLFLTIFFLKLLDLAHTVIDCALCRLEKAIEFLLKTEEVLMVSLRLIVVELALVEHLNIQISELSIFFEHDFSVHLQHL